jgi:hypothetical protein
VCQWRYGGLSFESFIAAPVTPARLPMTAIP